MSVISRQELLDLKALMVSEKSAFGGCLIHEDVIQKSHEYEMSLLDRAEKAEVREKAMKLILISCVQVLNRHIIPNGISDNEALDELYGHLDNREICQLIPEVKQ
jgi:hypothetical protein